MYILIFMALLLILFSVLLSAYSLFIYNISLLISSLSVVTASISGLVAIMILKANKDNERPFVIIKPNYKRYGLIQISVENYGREIAIIERSEVDKQIKLLGGENFFEQIKGLVIPPNNSVTFNLIPMTEYEKSHKNYTTTGIIYYKNTEGKKFKSNILFNIEKLGPTPYSNDEEQKMFFELQKIPEELKGIKKQLSTYLKDELDK